MNKPVKGDRMGNEVRSEEGATGWDGRMLSLVHFVLDARSKQVDGSAILEVEAMIVGKQMACDFPLEIALGHSDNGSRMFGGRSGDEHARPELV